MMKLKSNKSHRKVQRKHIHDKKVVCVLCHVFELCFLCAHYMVQKEHVPESANE